ncbi:hypothetical protein AMTRI_Chr12g237920 [Amborella trichopoda]
MSFSFTTLLNCDPATTVSKDIGLSLTLTCNPPCENIHHLCMDLVIRERITCRDKFRDRSPYSLVSSGKESRRCSILSTAQNMPTPEDAIYLVCQKLNQVDLALPNIGNLVSSYMFGAAEVLRANPNGHPTRIDLKHVREVSLTESFFGGVLKARATESKEDVCVVLMSELNNGARNISEMPCPHQYNEECVSN